MWRLALNCRTAPRHISAGSVAICIGLIGVPWNMHVNGAKVLVSARGYFYRKANGYMTWKAIL